jgi:hypothetical protein
LIRPKKSIQDNIMFIGVRDGILYMLYGKPIQALVYDNENLCELWHMRLGHLHYRYFLILRGIFTSLPEFSIEQQGVCKGCALGNNAKDDFPSTESRYEGILDLIHSYVSGMISVASLHGSSYYVTFIDNFSMKN